MAKTKDTPNHDLKKIRFRGGDLKITIEGKSQEFWNGDLITATIQHLIESADLHGWQKHDDRPEDEFFIAVLCSLTTVWKQEDHSEIYDNATRLEILRDIVRTYENHPALAEKVPDLPAEDG